MNDQRSYYIIPVLSWMVTRMHIELECYLEAESDGLLFAKSGSTIIGGNHFLQFNYLCSLFDVTVVTLGETRVFDSSIRAMNLPVIHANETSELYGKALEALHLASPSNVVIIPSCTTPLNSLPYFYPEILFREALAYSTEEWKKVVSEKSEANIYELAETDGETVSNARLIDTISSHDTYADFTMRIAERWISAAKGVAFGDPDAIAAQLATLCRKKYVAVYGELQSLKPSEIVTDPYAEQQSSIAQKTVELALRTGNPVILGRQTGDGDIISWSARGGCIQIMDPNRPPFPIVETLHHEWSIKERNETIFDLEPDDTQLERWITEGKILATIMVHSGEMAHNEAMSNLFELAVLTNLKMGIGVHVARYRTLPQIFELLSVPKEKGGVLGYVEPVLHSGGRGVLSEFNAPEDSLQKHCETALKEIGSICGTHNSPRGYLAFMDSDFATFTNFADGGVRAAEHAGLEYYISCAWPGRNRVLYRSPKMIAVNQTTRKIYWGSPYIRASTFEDLRETCPLVSPGWLVTTIDAPVIAFSSYIWKRGNVFMQMIDWLHGSENIVNVTPHVISRYAKMLADKGFLKTPILVR